MAAAINGVEYPRKGIRELWDIVLLNQFHDILPGTSIGAVYDDSDADYATLFAAMDSTQGPLQSVLNTICPPSKGQLWLVNFTGQNRDGELVEFRTAVDISGAAIRTVSGEAVLQSITRANGDTRFVAPVADIPALGWSAAQVGPAVEAAKSGLNVSDTVRKFRPRAFCNSMFLRVCKFQTPSEKFRHRAFCHSDFVRV